jgi:hypothetical protein
VFRRSLTVVSLSPGVGAVRGAVPAVARVCVVVCVVVFGASACATARVPAAGPVPEGRGDGGPLRVVLIGNSQLGAWGEHPQPPDLARALVDVAAQAHGGTHRLAVTRVVRPGGGCTEFAAEGQAPGSPLAAAADIDVDVVVLFPSIDETDRGRHEACWDLFRSAAARAGHRFVVVATPHVAQAWPAGFAALDRAIGKWAEERGVPFVPAGAAWRRALGDHPPRDALLSLFHGDLEHPGPEGSYLTVLALYAVLTGARVTDAGIDNDLAALRCDPHTPCLTEQEMRACLDDAGAWQCPAANGAVFSNHRVHFVTDDEAGHYQRVVDDVVFGRVIPGTWPTSAIGRSPR